MNSSDQLLKSFDGWHKKALEGGRVVTAATGTGNGQLSRKHFNQAIKAMPRQYVNRNSGLRFYASTGLIQDYLYSQSEMGIVPNEVIAKAKAAYATARCPRVQLDSLLSSLSASS